MFTKDTHLHLSAKYGLAEITKYFLEHGADHQQRNAANETAEESTFLGLQSFIGTTQHFGACEKQKLLSYVQILSLLKNHPQ